jgi:hypothetical protein
LAAGRRLHATGFAVEDVMASVDSGALGPIGATTMLGTAPLLDEAASAPDDSAATSTDPDHQRLSTVALTPAFIIQDKAIVALPMQVVWTSLDGRDATDVATCLSGALLHTGNVTMLVSQAALAGSQEIRHAVDSLASGILPQLLPEGGDAALFTSSMYKGGPRLSARELKAALVRHYASLLLLPSCLRVPPRAAYRLRVALSNIIKVTTETTTVGEGELADFKDELTTLAELHVEVDQVLNEKHPELCAGIEGSSFRLRFAGFGGRSSLSAASAEHIWVYAAVAETGGGCDDVLPKQ